MQTPGSAQNYPDESVSGPILLAVNGLTFRPWIPDDKAFLWEMLYQSLHVPDGEEPFPRSVLDQADIAHYLRDFGSLSGDDAQLCIGDSGNQVGAAWCRRLTSDDPGYGYVGDEVPELGMAVDMDWRGRGVGRHLLEDLLARHPAMSLSVDNANTSATALYLSLGFVPVGVAGTYNAPVRS